MGYFILLVLKLFLPHDAMLVRYMLSSYVRPSIHLSVRLSVCVSQARKCTKMAKRRITQTTHTIAHGL